ncbi:hypothetical protein [Flavisolibacter tropicus]|uniref:Uncharacterized protein n=1 Tax=Flavisolibacter tropicus TaxID=1492898 RepID=A0A172TZW6_9BACT|nr:hypothetical protein [Flavisolibacter tropicus]ANE52610.1 hypothetical protein SY85_21125 [Flavisolibacter tropicus]
MLLTIKESAALYVMDLVMSKLATTIEESSSALENIEAWITSHVKEEEIPIISERNKEDILMLLRY